MPLPLMLYGDMLMPCCRHAAALRYATPALMEATPARYYASITPAFRYFADIFMLADAAMLFRDEAAAADAVLLLRFHYCRAIALSPLHATPYEAISVLLPPMPRCMLLMPAA